jgi:hypothetical protein
VNTCVWKHNAQLEQQSHNALTTLVQKPSLQRIVSILFIERSTEKLTLRRIGHLERRLCPLTTCRRTSAGRFKSIHRIHAPLRHARVIFQIQPRHRALAGQSGTRPLRRIRLVQLANLRHRVRASRQLVKSKGRRVGAIECRDFGEEMVAEQVLVPLGEQAEFEDGILRAEGQGKAGDGGDFPLDERVAVKRCANVVEFGWGDFC